MRILSLTAGILVFCSFINGVSAQPRPPRPIVVTSNSSRMLAFGAFTPGPAGGTVVISPGGIRSSTGDIILFNLGYTFSSAEFYVRANIGTVVSILNVPPVTLTGSGGGSMSLQIGPSVPQSPFVIALPWPQLNSIYIGGTLTVGNIVSNPPGSYQGSFSVTFVQE